MKHILICMIWGMTSIAFADQQEILVQGRDHFIREAVSKIRSYCPEAPEDTYLCRLQLEADCFRDQKKNKKACRLLKKVNKLEEKILISDKNLGPENKNKILSKTVKAEIGTAKPVPKISTPSYQAITVSRGSSDYNAPRESDKDNQELRSLQDKINAMKIRVDCQADSDCQIMNYGRRICGGPVGTFVYSTVGGEHLSVYSEIAKFNEADKAFIDNWNKDLMGTCDWRGRLEPAKCAENICH